MRKTNELMEELEKCSSMKTSNMRVSRCLRLYADAFDESFPYPLLSKYDGDELCNVICDCVKKGEPIKHEYIEGVLY